MPPVIDWLLKGDPAIRWQVQRDLLEAGLSVYDGERARIPQTGWGRRLLAQQAADGNWGGGLYSPKWTSTTYTLLLLRDMGLPHEHPQARRACANFLARDLDKDGGINLFKSLHYSETCVNGMLLSLLAYFRFPDARIHDVAAFLLREQMPDGGWNCERIHGATHASFHTTILVLEGLREYAGFAGAGSGAVATAVARGLQFLLCHRLYKSHRTGAVVDGEMTRLHFPPRWHYDILRGLDYFRSIGAMRDERLADAVNLLENKRSADGRWSLNKSWPGRTFFEIEPSGAPSRWNTLRALRVLKWWSAPQDPPTTVS